MSGVVVALVLGSSLLHASWNVLVKRSIDKAVFSWLASLVAAVLAAPYAVAWWDSWSPAPWLCMGQRFCLLWDPRSHRVAFSSGCSMACCSSSG